MNSLARMLHQPNLSVEAVALALALAWVLGAAHALTPGHGKTLVAAYLVGSRGTLRHAAYLGAMVTFTHTISVFALGLATLFLFRFVVPAQIARGLGVVSGISIVAIGGWMLWRRWSGAHEHPHHHDHHDHDHPHSHAHVPDELSWGSLTALAVSGGLVPCESALVLLLSAIAIGRAGLGLLLLVAFSLGLAAVLMAIGMLVLYARSLIPERKTHSAWFRWVPVGSALVVVCVGVVMTGVSLGWVKWLAA